MQDKMNFEKRRSVRIKAPSKLIYNVNNQNILHQASCQDISPDGIGFMSETQLYDGDLLDIKLEVGHAINPMHLTGVVSWSQKVSTEDKALFNTGIQFTSIEEDNKNTFLKFLCDMLYESK